MDRAKHEFDRATRRMSTDLKTMIADGEDLLKAAASVSGEGFAAARSRFEERIGRAKAALVDASQPLVDKTRESAAVADDYVHGSPWTAIGVAAVAGLLLGILAARR